MSRCLKILEALVVVAEVVVAGEETEIEMVAEIAILLLKVEKEILETQENQEAKKNLDSISNLVYWNNHSIRVNFMFLGGLDLENW